MNRAIRNSTLLLALAMLSFSLKAQQGRQNTDSAITSLIPTPARAAAWDRALVQHASFGAGTDPMHFHASLVNPVPGQALPKLQFGLPGRPPQVPLFGYSKLSTGVLGVSGKTFGVEGKTSGTNLGAFGASATAAGIFGSSSGNAPGVYGRSKLGDGGLFFGGGIGNGVTAFGGSTDSNDSPGIGGYFQGGATGSGTVPGGAGIVAVGGDNASGDEGYASAPGVGVSAKGGNNFSGSGADGGDFTGGNSAYMNGGYGIYATGGFSNVDFDDGVDTAPAGFFNGDVVVKGILRADSKNFQIDDPHDPANKYLNHASIESSEMVNIYSGNVTTDTQGLATVQLPVWFETLNGDLRYQLTTIGKKAQAWISEEVKDGNFKIASDSANVKVSWQITGVRQDPWARAHPLIVEQEKNGRERGLYRHPELYGQPPEKQTEWAQHPGKERPVRPAPWPKSPQSSIK